MTEEEHRAAAMDSTASKSIAAGEVCGKTGRPYERGHGALSKEQQTANFLREQQGLRA